MIWDMRSDSVAEAPLGRRLLQRTTIMAFEAKAANFGYLDHLGKDLYHRLGTCRRTVCQRLVCRF